MKFHRPALSILTTLAAFGLPASAQETHVFDIVQSSSNFTWSGTSTLGPILGNPSNMFQFAGTTNIDLTFQLGAQPFATGAYSGGAAATVPDLHGRIPNPIPLLPPLATIDIVGLVVSPTSPAFAVGAGGGFSASLTLTALAGTMTVTPLGSAPTSTPLAGSSSTPTTVNGTLTTAPGLFLLNQPINVTFPFTDPGTGASGSVTLVGTLVANHARIRSFCAGDGTGTACPCANHAPAGSGRGCLNSTGVGALLSGAGVASVTGDTLVLSASGMAATATALYFQGNAQINAGAGSVFGDGKRCVTATVIRLGTKTSVGGASSYPQLGDIPVSVRGAVPAGGAIRHYQTWYRNSAAYCTPDLFNLTNGLSVTWVP